MPSPCIGEKGIGGLIMVWAKEILFGEERDQQAERDVFGRKEKGREDMARSVVSSGGGNTTTLGGKDALGSHNARREPAAACAAS